MLALICARGGSKGIHKKNLQMVGPRTLVEWSLWAAEQLPAVDRIAISSDDKDILDSLSSPRLTKILRPSHLAQDSSPEWLAWRHALDYLRDIHGYTTDSVLSLPPTSPLRLIDTVKAAIETFHGISQPDTVVVYTDCTRHPEFNLVTTTPSERLVKLWSQPPSPIYNRQQARCAFDLTTVCFISSVENINSTLSPLSGRVQGVWSPKANAIDIDNPIDLELARVIYSSNI